MARRPPEPEVQPRSRGVAETVGRRLQVTRLAYEISQKEVGDILGVDVTAVSRYESGKRQMDVEQLHAFISAMYVTADWILLGYVDQVVAPVRNALQGLAPDLVCTRPKLRPSAGQAVPALPTSTGPARELDQLGVRAKRAP